MSGFTMRRLRVSTAVTAVAKRRVKIELQRYACKGMAKVHMLGTAR